MRYKNIIIGCILFLLFNHAFAQNVEQTRTINRTFALTKQSSIKVSNKYGNVMLNTWDKDSVGFAVSIRVSERREADAIAKLSTIDVKFTTSPYFIDAITTFNSNKGSLGADIADKITNGIFNTGPNVSVDYIISLPPWVSLEIANKYGNIYMTDHSGSLKVGLSNGDFKAGNLNGESNLVIEFGNITINSMRTGRMEVGYSELVLKEAGTLHLTGRSSKCWITKAEALELDSKRDKFYIDTLNTLNGECSFSLVQIAMLDRSGLLRSNYGDVRINGTSQSISGINLNSEYTDVVITLPQSLTYSLIADYKKTIFTLPVSATAMQSQLIDEKAQQYHLSGTAGPGSSTPANLLLNAVGGSITLLLK